MSPGEFAEYEKRKTEFRALMSQWSAAVHAEQQAIMDKVPKDRHAWISPLDMVSNDPIERIGLINERLNIAERNGKLRDATAAGARRSARRTTDATDGRMTVVPAARVSFRSRSIVA